MIDDDEDSLRLCLATVPMPDLEETNADEESALHIVAGRGRLDMLKLLLDAGADPNCEDDFGRSALRHCVEVHKDSFGADQLSCMTALLSARRPKPFMRLWMDTSPQGSSNGLH